MISCRWGAAASRTFGVERPFLFVFGCFCAWDRILEGRLGRARLGDDWGSRRRPLLLVAAPCGQGFASSTPPFLQPPLASHHPASPMLPHPLRSPCSFSFFSLDTGNALRWPAGHVFLGVSQPCLRWTSSERPYSPAAAKGGLAGQSVANYVLGLEDLGLGARAGREEAGPAHYECGRWSLWTPSEWRRTPSPRACCPILSLFLFPFHPPTA